MSPSLSLATQTSPDATTAVANTIRFLETGEAAADLFAPDVFADLTFPLWRVQTGSAADLIAVRAENHPAPGRVRVHRVDPTDTGFTMEFEEHWDAEGQRWYAREMLRADVDGPTITDLAIYCTGDWDEARQREHREAVELLRA